LPTLHECLSENEIDALNADTDIRYYKCRCQYPESFEEVRNDGRQRFYYAAAIILMTSEEYNDAIECLLHHLDSSSTDADAWYDLSRAYMKVNRTTQALASLNEVFVLSASEKSGVGLLYQKAKALFNQLTAISSSNDDMMKVSKRMRALALEHPEEHSSSSSSSSSSCCSQIEGGLDSFSSSTHCSPHCTPPMTSGPYPVLKELITKYADLVLHYREQFRSAQPFPHIYFDGIFPIDFLRTVAAEFPRHALGDPLHHRWHGSAISVQRYKMQCLNEYCMGPAAQHLIAHMKGQFFVEFLEHISGIDNLIPDPKFFGAGLHQTQSGGAIVYVCVCMYIH
jgi:tetratricopeptide (TPR) repeat protein